MLTYRSLTFSVGRTVYVVSGAMTLSVPTASPTTPVPASGEITVTGNGVRVGRWYVANGVVTVEVTGVIDPF